MDNRERLNVYFEMEEHNYLLFRVVNIGTKDRPDLKFSGFSNLYIKCDVDVNHHEKGYFSEEEIEQSSFHSNIEFTYHNDGSFMSKNMDFEDKSQRYYNPYGTGARWTAINDIHKIQPVIAIAIRRMEIYRPTAIEKKNNKVYNYICRNQDLFERQGKYFVMVFLKERSMSMACFTTAQGYSDILCSINDKLDLCIIFQRHTYPEAKSYYSELFGGGWITPYLNNSIMFCNKDTSIDEMNDKMKNIFNPIFSNFISIMGDGHIVNLSEDKLKIIDIVDKIYITINSGRNITKPLFIKYILNSIPNHNIFNTLPEKEKEDYIRTCYMLAGGKMCK